MNLLLEILNKILLSESISVNSVTDSITNKYRVVINYEGDPSHGIAPGIRTIEVYAYGLTKAGNPVIRAYQPYGDTASEVPSWKFFRLDRIKSWKPTYSLITKPAPNFNPTGDKSMSEVYLIANFNAPSDISNSTGPKQTYKQVGKISDVDKFISDKEKDKRKDLEQNKTISKFTSTPPIPIKEPEEPEKNIELPNKNIPEPDIEGIPKNSNEPEMDDKENQFKTKGEEELEKVKDLNRRLDNARKIDLSNIPKK